MDIGEKIDNFGFVILGKLYKTIIGNGSPGLPEVRKTQKFSGGCAPVA